MSFPEFTLVLGGVGSGKSAFAEALVRRSRLEKVYLATARADAPEMAERIARHRAGRAGQGWRTVEVPVDLSAALREVEAGEIALLDSVTAWLANLDLARRDWRRAAPGLMEALTRAKGPVVVVSDEMGLGGPASDATGLARQRVQGEINRDLAAAADLVVLMIAGLPAVVKGILPHRGR